MEQPSDPISDLVFGDMQSAIMSLQLLDEAVFLDDDPLPSTIDSTINFHTTLESYGAQAPQIVQVQQNIMPSTTDVDLIANHKDDVVGKSVRTDSEINSLEENSQGHFQVNMLSESHLSRRLRQLSDGCDEIVQAQQTPIDELRMLKVLQEKSMLEMRDSEHAEQIKQNFEVLFQKVYGIIEEIQSRNQKSEVDKSQVKSNLRQSVRKELSLNTKVVELHLNKENNGAKRKFNNIQTQFDYNNEAYDQGEELHNSIKTESNYPRTPFNSSRAKASCLLSLSKQFPPLASPQANNATARSDKSFKSKGLSLVSAEKKVLEEKQVKRPIKITLLQKKIVPCPTKKIELSQKSRADKKVTAFSPSNFFSSRRVSSSHII